MSFSSLNAEYVDPEIIKSLGSAVKEEDTNASAELTSITSMSDLNQVKEKIRNTHWNIDHPIRRDLWVTLCNKFDSDCNVDMYRVLEKKLYGESDCQSNLPKFVDPAYSIPYCLNAEGKKRVEKIIHIINEAKPDIEYCVLLYPVVSLFLHYMSEEMTFSCVLKLLNDKQLCISQTKMDHLTSAFTAMLLAEISANATFVQLRKGLKTHDYESMFKNWLFWIFNDLPFPYLVRVMDCFLVDKMESLYRIFSALLMLYSEHVDKTLDVSAGKIRKIQRYFHNIAVPLQKLFNVAYGISELDEKSVKVQRLLAEVIAKRHLNLPEGSPSPNKLFSLHEFVITEKIPGEAARRKLSMDDPVGASADCTVELKDFKSEIITAEQMHLIIKWLPMRMTLMQPEVSYSSNKDGVSLTAFYMKVDALEPTVLIVKATNDEVFGAYCSSSWNTRNRGDRGYENFFGTGESFLFTLVPHPMKYRWIGSDGTKVPHSANLFMAANNTMITVGSGNGQGLLLHDQFLYGRTEHCDTFDNEPLCSMQDFKCKIVEVIAFKEI